MILFGVHEPGDEVSVCLPRRVRRTIEYQYGDCRGSRVGKIFHIGLLRRTFTIVSMVIYQYLVRRGRNNITFYIEMSGRLVS